MKAKKYEECCEGYLEQNKSMWIQSQVFRNKITCANFIGRMTNLPGTHSIQKYFFLQVNLF